MKKEIPQGFYFDAGTPEKPKHDYYYDGKKMTGVTTILNVIAKPQLIPWAANMAVDYVENHLPKFTTEEVTMHKESLQEILKEARTAHTRKMESAGQAGTDIHALVESYVRMCIALNKGEAMPYGVDPKTMPIDTFIRWAIKEKITFLASEKKVYSIPLFVAGTYDMKLKMGGQTYIADVKTQKAIYNRLPFAQMAAYQHMEAQMGEPRVDGRLIIHMPRERVFDPETDVYLSEHYDDDLKLFMAALEIYRNMNNRFEALSSYQRRK